MEKSDDKKHYRLYRDLSWTWPIISPPEEYIAETSEIIDHMKKYARIEIKRILNMGCGGGHNDFTLKKHFEVTGVDISEKMLALARDLNPEVTYLTGDMRTVRMDSKFDAVTIFDSVNYMASVNDLRALFRTSFDHLNPGGVMITYVEEWKETFRQNKTTHLVREKGDIEITLVENYYDPDPDDTSYEGNFIYFIRRRGELTIESDYHLLGIFPLQTWIDTMRETGFIAYRERSQIPNHSGDNCPIFIGIKP